jgi:hypothetical protein
MQTLQQSTSMQSKSHKQAYACHMCLITSSRACSPAPCVQRVSKASAAKPKAAAKGGKASPAAKGKKGGKAKKQQEEGEWW